MRRAGFLVLPAAAMAAVAVLVAVGEQDAEGAGARWVTMAVDRGAIVASVQAEARVAPVQDSGRLRLVAVLDAASLARVRPGQRAEVAPADQAGSPLAGVVREAVPAATGGGTVLAMELAPGAGVTPPPGATVALRIVTDRRENALRVPDAALRWHPSGTPEPALPPPVRGGHAVGVSDLADLVGRELGWDSATLAVAGAVLRDAETAAFDGLGPDADPAVRRERFKAMRRDMRERLAAIAGPEHRARVHELVAAWSDARRREAARAAVFHVVDEDGRPRPVPVRIGIGDGEATELLGAPVEPGTPVIVGERIGPARSGLRALLGF